MKKLLIALAGLPLMAGAAHAGQPQMLSDNQMDKVTAGFTATSIADAEGLVGLNGIVLTLTSTVSQVKPYAVSPDPGTFTIGGITVPTEATSTVFKSIAAASSATYTATRTALSLGLSAP
jgi:heterodisulfide reductase subunit A-like polyferredoxin